ncbi:TPA: restriction endonuclease subunit S [Vibrio vulnificus]|nr:restriction endonuclease subunit S [Vibrio vulnificus]
MSETKKYQAYPEYKDSGVDLLGIIPKHWEAKRLKYVSPKITVGVVVNPSTFFDDDGEVPFLRGVDVSRDKVSTENVKKINDIGNNLNSKSILKEGDLVSIRVGYPGVTAVIPQELDGANCASLLIIRKPSEITSRLLCYQINTDIGRNQIKLLQQGAAQEQINVSDIVDFWVVCPPEDEATNIQSFLDHETAKIDTLIEKQQQLIKLLKEKRQALISHAVTKGLNPQVPMKDSGVEWLGEVPEHWDVLRLKHLIESLESGVSVNAADIPARTDEVGVLKTSCVYTRTFRAEENKTVVPEDLHRVKCPVRKGAIIISRMNTPELVGASALVTEDVSNVYLPDRLWQTNFNQKVDLDSEYLAHFMTVEGFRVQISLAAEGASSSMQNIAKEDYLSINCLLPPLSEQQQIVQHIRQRLEYFSKLDSNANDAVNLLKERRTALISAAVTGKIDVRNWQEPTHQDQTLEQTA